MRPLFVSIYRAGLVLASAGLFFSPAWADYPDRPMRFVVGYPAGGAVDIVARLVGGKLADAFGKPVVVDNRPGASGNIATDVVAKSAPDGHTLLLGTVVDSISPSIISNLPFDFQRDLAPITLVVNYPFYLVVTPNLPISSVQELLAYAKTNPGKLNFGSNGNGSSPHLAGEMLKTLAAVDIVHVPYKGAPPMVTDMLAGQIQMAFLNAALALPMIRSGKLRALGVTGARRSSHAPELPTLIESGIQGFEIYSWFGVLTRAGTPTSVINRLNAEIVRVLGQPDVRSQLEKQGMDVTATTPDEFRMFIKAETLKHAKIVRDANIRNE